MEIAVTREEGRVPVTVLHVKGEIALDGQDQFLERAQEVYEAGARYLLLDLTDATFLSSSGLRTIHFLFDLLRRDVPEESDSAMRQGLRDGTFKSHHLKLLRPSGNVLRTLETAGYDMFLDIYTSLREAIASF